MYAVGRLGSYITRGVYTVSGPFHPFGGAVDIIVVEQQDGSFKSSPWYVRFGKFQGVLKAKEKVVSINVNGVDADFHMYLDNKGEAYFLRDLGKEEDEEEGVGDVYPLSSGDEAEGKLRRRLPEKSKSCNYDANRGDLVSPVEASDGKIVARTASNQSKIFGVVFGRRSIKKNGFVDDQSAADVVRVSSLERAEMAANLLEVKWSTNLASSRRRKSNSFNVSDPSLMVPEPRDVLDGSSKDLGSREFDKMMEETNAQISSSPDPVSYMESFTLEETYLEVNFIPEGSRSFNKVDNADPDSDQNVVGDTFPKSNPISSISHAMELKENAERPFDMGERYDQTGFSGDRSSSKAGSILNRVETFYYEAVEDVMEASDVSVGKINDTVGLMASENGEPHVRPLDSVESIQQISDTRSEQVRSIPVTETTENLENGVCSESLDGPSGSLDEKAPVPSFGYNASSETVVAEVPMETGNIAVDEVKAIVQVEETKEVYFSAINCSKPSDVLEGNLAAELCSSNQNVMEEGPVNAVDPVEESKEASSGKGTNSDKASYIQESDVNTIMSMTEIRSGDSCTTLSSLNLVHGISDKEHIADNLAGKPSCSNAEEQDRHDLQEKVISGAVSTSSEEEQFHFSDDDSNSQEVEKVESGSSEPARSRFDAHDFPEPNQEEQDLNESGSIIHASHPSELESTEEDRHIQAELLERTSSPINIPEVHIDLDKESLKPIVESLPSMRSHAFDMSSHCVHPPRGHSVDSKLENMLLIKKDVPLPSSSDDEEVQASIHGGTTIENSQILEDLKKIVSDPAVELSLCRHLLYEGIGYEAASHVFDAEKLDADKFASLGPNVIENDKLVVRIGGLYFPWEAALPIASAIGSNGSEPILEPKGMIAVERVEKAEEVIMQNSVGPRNGNWRLWPFSFQRSKSINSRQLDLESPSRNTSGSLRDTNSPRSKAKTIRATAPTSEQLASLKLKEGKNVVTFTFSTAMLGEQQVDARIYLWKWNTKIVISDVDGTITKSDVLGQFMPLMGIDWSQTGVAHLFSAIKENGYQLLFLSARSISQAYHTRQFLFNLKQDGKALPEGPVVISPDGLFPSLYREVIRRAPHEFKIACLEDIKALFPSDSSPFYAGFGNRDTDEISYLKVGIPKGKIFIINPKGEIAVNRRVDTKSYMSLHTLVHDMFPPASSDEQEDFNSWNFWKLPPPGIDVCDRLARSS